MQHQYFWVIKLDLAPENPFPPHGWILVLGFKPLLVANTAVQLMFTLQHHLDQSLPDIALHQ
jgi:hypothetical protein